MAKVICSPNLNMECKRKLPIARSSAPLPENAHGDRDGNNNPGVDGLQGRITRDAERLSIQQSNQLIERLTAERDTALEKAKSVENQLSRLEEQLGEERQKARERGYQEGYRQGAEKAVAEQAEITESLNALLNSLSKEQIKLVQMAEDAAVEIGFAAAAKILGQLNVDRKLLAAMIKEAMSKVAEREGLIIHLSAADCRKMQEVKEQCGNGQAWSGIDFKEDDQVGLGGCIVRSRVGFLDARLEYQVNELKRLLTATRTTDTDTGDPA